MQWSGKRTRGSSARDDKGFTRLANIATGAGQAAKREPAAPFPWPAGLYFPSLAGCRPNDAHKSACLPHHAASGTNSTSALAREADAIAELEVEPTTIVGSQSTETAAQARPRPGDKHEKTVVGCKAKTRV